MISKEQKELSKKIKNCKENIRNNKKKMEINATRYIEYRDALISKDSLKLLCFQVRGLQILYTAMLFCLSPTHLEIVLMLLVGGAVTEGTITYKKAKHKRRYPTMYKLSNREMKQKFSELKEEIEGLNRETCFIKTKLKTYKMQWNDLKIQQDIQDTNKSSTQLEKEQSLNLMLDAYIQKMETTDSNEIGLTYVKTIG